MKLKRYPLKDQRHFQTEQKRKVWDQFFIGMPRTISNEAVCHSASSDNPPTQFAFSLEYGDYRFLWIASKRIILREIWLSNVALYRTEFLFKSKPTSSGLFHDVSAIATFPVPQTWLFLSSSRALHVSDVFHLVPPPFSMSLGALISCTIDMLSWLADSHPHR